MHDFNLRDFTFSFIISPPTVNLTIETDSEFYTLQRVLIYIQLS
jgi:hypothetical protein